MRTGLRSQLLHCIVSSGSLQHSLDLIQGAHILIDAQIAAPKSAASPGDLGDELVACIATSQAIVLVCAMIDGGELGWELMRGSDHKLPTLKTLVHWLCGGVMWGAGERQLIAQQRRLATSCDLCVRVCVRFAVSAMPRCVGDEKLRGSCVDVLKVATTLCLEAIANRGQDFAVVVGLSKMIEAMMQSGVGRMLLIGGFLSGFWKDRKGCVALSWYQGSCGLAGVHTSSDAI